MVLIREGLGLQEVVNGCHQLLSEQQYSKAVYSMLWVPDWIMRTYEYDDLIPMCTMLGK